MTAAFGQAQVEAEDVGFGEEGFAGAGGAMAVAAAIDAVFAAFNCAE